MEMQMLNKAFGRILGFAVGKAMPERLVWMFARRFIAGKDRISALGTARRLNQDGFLVSLDYIGEELSDCNEIQKVKLEYLALVEAMNKLKILGDISLKLSHVGFEPASTLNIIAAEAKKSGIRVWIDAERLMWRDQTWEVARRLSAKYGNIGIRIQAYAEDAFSFLAGEIENGWRGQIGVCKGAYREPNYRTLMGRPLHDNFIKLSRLVVESGLFLQIDTHDEELTTEVDIAIGSTRHEHGLLRGVNSVFAGLLRDIGESVNIYLPYGPDCRAYIARRIVEHPEYIFLPFRS